jgi:hypothetical protein
MTDDIVKHLRESACGNDCRCPYCNRNKAAADEIERLRTELAKVSEELEEMRDSHRRILQTYQQSIHTRK